MFPTISQLSLCHGRGTRARSTPASSVLDIRGGLGALPTSHVRARQCVIESASMTTHPMNPSTNLSPLYRAHKSIEDRISFAFCTGTGWLIRLYYLTAIGGRFPASSLTEDIYTSVKVLSAGWWPAYVGDAPQSALMPGTTRAHGRQMCRWVSRPHFPSSLPCCRTHPSKSSDRKGFLGLSCRNDQWAQYV